MNVDAIIANHFAGELLLTDAGHRQLAAAASAVAALGSKPVAALPQRIPRGSVALVRLYGPLARRDNWISDALGWSTIDGFRAAILRADAEPNVSKIVIDVDSPGGSVAGLAEASDAVRNATTPIVAHTSGVMASAALWLTVGADKLYTGRTGLVGSIGIKSLYFAPDAAELTSSRAPNKNPSRERAQAMIDELEAEFIRTVAAGRGVDEATVVERFGGGGILVGQRAVDAGLVDGVASLDDVIVGRAGATRSTGAAAAALSGDEVMAEAIAIAADTPRELFARRLPSPAPVPAGDTAASAVATPAPVDADDLMAAAFANLAAEERTWPSR